MPQAQQSGAFRDEDLSQDLFRILSVAQDGSKVGDDDSSDDDLEDLPPSLQRTASSKIVLEEQSRRSLALCAAALSQEKVSLKLARDSSAECDVSTPPLLIRPPSMKRPVSSTSSADIASTLYCNSEIESECSVCFESSPTHELWGGGVLQKSCRCSILVCLSCLTQSAKADIARKVKPVCTHTVSYQPVQRCKVPLDPSLLGQMLRDQCPTCPPSDDGTGGCDFTGELINVGCALEAFHTFCPKCLQSDVIESVCIRRTLPRCLRAAECKHDYDEDSLRVVLTATVGGASMNEDEVDDIVEQWHRLRLEQLQNSWKGNKKCLAIDCQGYLQASLQMSRRATSGDGSVNVQCSHCHVSFCWGCQV
jgi:hypothetical protein